MSIKIVSNQVNPLPFSLHLELMSSLLVSLDGRDRNKTANDNLRSVSTARLIEPIENKRWAMFLEWP